MKAPVNIGRTSRKKYIKQKFYIFCEGVNTEKEYIEHYNAEYCRASIEVIFGAGGADPKALVDRALKKLTEISSPKYKREYGSADQIWVVFDRDDHPHFIAAKAKAERFGIRVAYSDPCFELWLVLHVENYNSPQGRHALQDHCETVCPGYSKSSRKVPNLKEIIGGVRSAEERALSLEVSCAQSGSTVPLTNVYTLTKSLRSEKSIFGHIATTCMIDSKIFAEPKGLSKPFPVDVDGLSSSHLKDLVKKHVEELSHHLGLNPGIETTKNASEACVLVYFSEIENPPLFFDDFEIDDTSEMIMFRQSEH